MASAPIATESIINTIAKLRNELSALEHALGVEGAVVMKKAGKKAKDPNAEPKEANVWIKFTQRVGALVKGAHPDSKAPATLGKQFCSFLKDQKSYEQWEDGEILEAYSNWTPPEQSKMEKKAKADSSSETGSVSDGSKKRGPRGPLSEEALAARREKMASKKDTPPRNVSSAALAFAETPAPAPAPVEPPAAPKKSKSFKPTYTPEQLSDFDGFEYEGASYGRNARGDVAGEDGSYVGHWNGKTLKKGGAIPADWAEITA